MTLAISTNEFELLPPRSGSPPTFGCPPSWDIPSDERSDPDDKPHVPDSDVLLGEPSIPSPFKSPFPRHDDTFYLQHVTFQVENTLFRVSKTGFMVPGTIFEVMFALPLGETENLEGSSDTNPIHLSVDEGSFKSFLRVLYPSLVKDDALDAEETYCHLVAALDLATMWEFHRVRKEIISRLTPIVNTRNNLEVIFLARKYEVANWLRASYKKLVNPVIDLPMNELTCSPFALEWPTIAKIYHIRETLMKTGIEMQHSSTTCQKCRNTYGCDYGTTDLRRYSCDCRIVTMIDTQFQVELSPMAEQLPDVFNVRPPSARIVTSTATGKKKKKKQQALQFTST